MRLIDADNYKDVLYAKRNNPSIRNGIASAIAMLGKQETVDAVPVVRCKDCKEGEVDDPDFPDQYYCHAGCGWNKENFFCSYGERKDGDG